MPSTKANGYRNAKKDTDFCPQGQSGNADSPGPGPMDSRALLFVPYAWLALVVFFSGVLCYFSLEAGHAWSGDFALYFRQAQAIIQGNAEELLAFNKYAMEHSVYSGAPIGPNLYPWGFPLLLSPIYALFGADIMIMKTYIVVFLLLSLVILWHLFWESLGRVNAILLVALVGFNPYLVNNTNSVKSDIPFLFFALLGLLLMQKVMREKWVVSKFFTYFLTGLIMLAAFLVRSNGIVLPLVLASSQVIAHWGVLKSNVFGFLRNNPNVLLPYLVFGAGVLVVNMFLPSGSDSYLSFFAGLTFAKLLSHLIHYLVLPARFFAPAIIIGGYPVAVALYFFTLPFTCLGIWRNWYKDCHYIIYVTLTLAIVIIFPIPVFLRLIFSVFPFYLYFTFIGLMEAEGYLWRNGAFTGGGALFSFFRGDNLLAFFKKGADKVGGVCSPRLVRTFSLVILVLFVYRTSADAVANMRNGRVRKNGPYSAGSQELFFFLKNHTPPAAELVFHTPRALSMFTQRQSLLITSLPAMKGGKGDYLVYQKAKHHMQITPSQFEQLKIHHQVRFENTDFIVLQLKGSPNQKRPESY